MKHGLALAVMAVLVVSHGAPPRAAPASDAPPGWKPELLSDAEERRWVEAVKAHPTADGATVIQVVRHAEKLRPARFKLASIEPVYSGAGGKPAGVTVGYWIGLKRLEGDAYSDLRLDVAREGGRLVVSVPAEDRTPRTMATALERGRDAFVTYVDAMYRDTCLDAATHEKFC